MQVISRRMEKEYSEKKFEEEKIYVYIVGLFPIDFLHMGGHVMCNEMRNVLFRRSFLRKETTFSWEK